MGEIDIKKSLLRQRIIIGVLAVTLAAGGVGFVGYQKGWFGKEETPVEKAEADIDPNAGEWDGTIPEAPKGDPDAETISIPGYPSIYIPAGKTDVDVAFVNPEGNPCYFTFQLVLKDTDEVIYESKQVPPGEAITKATLTKALEEGNYPATLRISTASIKDQSEMNGANMETVLEVK